MGSVGTVGSVGGVGEGRWVNPRVEVEVPPGGELGADVVGVLSEEIGDNENSSERT